ncbi:hypothetical protein [Vibrio campbellii]|uniref:hypothetical protein n=1 Tax=Vibrio campbellii TaxID=680 RepID=UPI00210B32FB|nr:hypothetical protein [Vibrio campbellii]UTZ44597.1 hypothetical protein HB764_25395 [Vibrio campbellii]
MKYVLAFLLSLFSCFALADMGAMSDEEFGFFMTALKWVAGDYEILIIVILLAIGYIYAQVRQCISPQTMAKLPRWLIISLEYLAANKGHAQNALIKNPLELKRRE